MNIDVDRLRPTRIHGLMSMVAVPRPIAWVLGLLLAAQVTAPANPPGQYRLLLNPEMLTAPADYTDFSGLVDEQLDLGDPPSGEPRRGWEMNAKHFREFPFSVILDLGAPTPLATLWIYDTNNHGPLRIAAGEPDAWRDIASYDCARYLRWHRMALDLETRYLRLTLETPGAIFTEIALDAYSPTGWATVQAKQAETARREVERQTALAKAREEALKRPLVQMAPYGTLSLIDETDLGRPDPGHRFRPDQNHPPSLQTVLGRSCRVLPKTSGESTFFTVRMGEGKLLRPGAAYVLAVDYPEDAPRSMVIVNTGNETSRGIHTGLALGDALNAKYVDHHVESLDIPLSGQWETWSLLFHLHDRFPERGLVRGSATPRTLMPENGFDVSIAQFAIENAPLSAGAAVAVIRLYEVIDPERLAQPLVLPPDDLPQRRIFWREEMADGVIGGKNPEDRGVDSPLDWYRYKAERMRFLGINTFSKDLLEFGACQHWDPTPYGGNDWVFFNAKTRGLWAEIVALMSGYGFDVLPYYEYSGSKGYKGLGDERRATPLTRDDAYTHVQWIESANADLTDPDTLTDFKKMLDLTVVNLADKADFAGVWLRPRSQLPIGFGPAARVRFANEGNDGRAVTRDEIRADPVLYDRYLDWWQQKRHAFFTAVRDHLRANGIDDALVLYTGCPAEPGIGFGDWEPRFVTDSPESWRPVLDIQAHRPESGSSWTILTPEQVRDGRLYEKGLTSPGLNWGEWEVHHAQPADDPERLAATEGVLFSHAFNRLYTVNAPTTLDLFRGPSGLALVRHYGLNEHMMHDASDKPKLGYFVADIERAGPYCMLAEIRAMAEGDPTMIGYLCGSNYGRGFPAYARDFNANFLALPALPSERLVQASELPDVVVRRILTPNRGTYYAVVNTGFARRVDASVKLGGTADSVRALVSGKSLPLHDGRVTLDLRPCQLMALHMRGTKD